MCLLQTYWCWLDGSGHFHKERFLCSLTPGSIQLCLVLSVSDRYSCKAALSFICSFIISCSSLAPRLSYESHRGRAGRCVKCQTMSCGPSFLQPDLTGGFEWHLCTLTLSSLRIRFFTRGFSDSTCRLLLCGSVPLVHHEYAGMDELETTQIRLPTGVSCYIGYYKANGEEGEVKVVTLLWQCIRVQSGIRRKQILNEYEKKEQNHSWISRGRA